MVKGSELPPKVTLAATDSLYVIDNDGPTPVSKNTAAAQVINPNPVYGQLSAVSAGTTQTGITSTFAKINQFDTISSQVGVTVDLAQSHFIANEDGIYKLSFSLSYSGDANQVFHISFFVNDVLITKAVTLRTIQASTDIGNVGTSVIESLSQNDVVDIRVKTTLAGSHDFTVQAGNFMISKKV